MRDDETPLFDRRDVLVSALVVTLAITAWCLPQRWWPRFAERLVRLRLAGRGALTAEERSLVAIVTGDRPPDWMTDVYWPSALRHKYLSWIQILACRGPRRWTPDVRLIGREHVDAALALGRGVVLFTATFAYKDLMAKAAFAGAGIAVSHLSKDTHGFSETRFGRRVLNRIYTGVEERFLQERMVFSGGDTKEVGARLRDRLANNQAVMITVTPLGRHVAVRPFLNGQIHIATGGLNFACVHDTPVLPVFTLREADGSTVTIVGSALERPAGRSRTETIDAMLDDYVPRLEAYVSRYPEQFSFPLSRASGTLLLGPPEERRASGDLQTEKPAA